MSAALDSAPRAGTSSPGDAAALRLSSAAPTFALPVANTADWIGNGVASFLRECESFSVSAALSAPAPRPHVSDAVARGADGVQRARPQSESPPSQASADDRQAAARGGSREGARVNADGAEAESRGALPELDALRSTSPGRKGEQHRGRRGAREAPADGAAGCAAAGQVQPAAAPAAGDFGGAHPRRARPPECDGTPSSSSAGSRHEERDGGTPAELRVVCARGQPLRLELTRRQRAAGLSWEVRGAVERRELRGLRVKAARQLGAGSRAEVALARDESSGGPTSLSVAIDVGGSGPLRASVEGTLPVLVRAAPARARSRDSPGRCVVPLTAAPPSLPRPRQGRGTALLSLDCRGQGKLRGRPVSVRGRTVLSPQYGALFVVEAVGEPADGG